MWRRLTILTLTAVLAGPTAAVTVGPAEAAVAPRATHCHRTLASYPILHAGDRRPAVRTLQCALDDLGFDVMVDGWYGPQTKHAIHRITQGFEGQGEPHPYRINNGFWTLLYGRQLPRDLPRYGERRPAVRVLQRALRAAGADIVVDGWFGPQTRRVVRAYQREQDQRPTGRVDRGVAFNLAMGAPFGDLS